MREISLSNFIITEMNDLAWLFAMTTIYQEVVSMKNVVDNLSTSKVILMCGPAAAGKSTLAKKFKSTGMREMNTFHY